MSTANGPTPSSPIVRYAFPSIISPRTRWDNRLERRKAHQCPPSVSAIYTSALLRLQDHWNNSTLGMYVDDGVIMAHADDWESVDCLLIARYRRCEEWLRRSNLAIEPDKTEVLYFRRPYQRNDFPPNRICLPNPSENTSYAVQASDTVRYLGFFINHKLDWEPHVTIMCNRARASIKALQVLGSSHAGCPWPIGDLSSTRCVSRSCRTAVNSGPIPRRSSPS
jgi:hypothetical protein